MTKLIEVLHRAGIRQDERGQDLVEYALLAGFVAVAAAATLPPVGDQISTIFSRVISHLDTAGAA